MCPGPEYFKCYLMTILLECLALRILICGSYMWVSWPLLRCATVHIENNDSTYVFFWV